ncbi:D-cysteine desulfhydrase [Thalassocella blandensis]|nr:D-cysteine desulfhydrase [Thalassocella blandensis]
MSVLQSSLALNRPQKLSLACTPTPLRHLKHVSSRLGGKNLWLKCDDLTGGLISGNKVRKLEYLLFDALQQGANTVVTCGGLQSNHCRATAVLCAQLGLHCHLVLRADHPFDEEEEERGADYLSELTGNLLISELCGATISIFSPSYYQRNLNTILADVAQRYSGAQATEEAGKDGVDMGGVAINGMGKAAYIIPTGGSNSLGLWGYIDAYDELIEQCQQQEFSPDAIVCASGSGGTQGGLTLAASVSQDVKVYGFAVCDSAPYFQRKIQQDVASWQASYGIGSEIDLVGALQIRTNDSYIGPGYGKGYDALFTCIAEVARLDGVVLDPVYTGKAFYGMLEEIKHGELQDCDNIVFLHTGGIYGIFPFAQNLSHVYSE